jgi:hypothetical protein
MSSKSNERTPRIALISADDTSESEADNGNDTQTTNRKPSAYSQKALKEAAQRGETREHLFDVLGKCKAQAQERNQKKGGENNGWGGESSKSTR